MLGTLAIFAAGCAVTTVDVDVYKGPLVNDEDVQVSQTAAMVSGAKPLLLELRNQFEESYRRKMRRFPYEVPPKLQGEFVRPPDGKIPSAGSWWFASESATRVNAILYLYEDAWSTDARALAAPLILARDEYLTSLSSSGIIPTESADAAAIKGLADPLQAAIANQRKSLEEQHLLFPSTEPSAAQLKHGARPSSLLITDRPEDAATAEGRELIQRVNDQQNALAQMWRAAIRLARDSDDAAFRKMPNSDRVQRDLAQLITALTNPGALAFALYGANPPAGVLRLRMSLDPAVRQALRLQAVPFLGSLPGVWNPVSDALSALLTSDLPGTADQLEELSRYFTSPEWTSGTPPPGLEKERGDFATISARKFGVANGPMPPTAGRFVGAAERLFPAPVYSSTIATVIADISAITYIAGVEGLEGGRLPQGINHLVEEYITKRHQMAAADAAVLSPERDQMLTALANFAEKILFLANNQQLLIGHATDDFGNSIYTEENTKRYAMLLQAIGNSILVQVDELRHMDKHADADVDLAQMEADILENIHAHGPTGRPATTQPGADLADGLELDELKESLAKPKNPRPSELRRQTGSRRQVIDRLIAKLEYEYAQAIISNGPDGSLPKGLKAAIDMLYQRRSTMVYIRPPAAFLRNSYPVTSLQQSSAGLWTNELSRESARAMPFAEMIRDYAYDVNGRRDAALQRSIDKVFWQNINRIRVAGSGRTNYVIAKDDVGNWYVKGYSADPKDIIESAREMASYSIGAPVSSPTMSAAITGKRALDQQGSIYDPRTGKVESQKPSGTGSDHRGTTPPATQGGSAPAQNPSASEQRAQNTALHNFQQQELDGATAAYGKSLQTLSQNIDSAARELNQAIEIAWDRRALNDAAFKNAADRADAEMRKSLPAIPKDSSDVSGLEWDVQNRLSAMKAYRDTLLGELYVAPTSQPVGEERAAAPLAHNPSESEGQANAGAALHQAAPTIQPATAEASGDTRPATQATRPTPLVSPATTRSAAATSRPTLDAAQRDDAFRIAAETVRSKLQPLLRDALDLTGRYEAQLQVLGGK